MCHLYTCSCHFGDYAVFVCSAERDNFVKPIWPTLQPASIYISMNIFNGSTAFGQSF